MSKILIVDDEPNIVLSLEFLLRKNGYEVFIARNGTEAINAATTYKPNLVLLDIMMPDVDGYQVCEQIKADPNLNTTKVVFLSAKSKKLDIEKGYQVGADLYVKKPFATKELLQKIKELLN